jgi:DNA-binding response OmpR family regulator
MECADFLCGRKLFSDVLTLSMPQKSSTKEQIQLIIGENFVNLGGKILISNKSDKQFNLFKLLLRHLDKTLSLQQIADELEGGKEIVLDLEQDVRRTINRIRKQIQALGYSENALIGSTKAGYCLHSQAFSILQLQ